MQANRTMSRVKSVSTPSLLLVFLVISMGLAAPVVALGERTLVSGTGFYVVNNDEVSEVPLCLYGGAAFVVMACHLNLLVFLRRSMS